jgi:DNA topoisomerase-1
MDFSQEPVSFADPQQAAVAAGLRYIGDDVPGITRARAGTGFCYRDAEGRLVKDKKTLERIRKLAIPPAWTDVWISPFPDSHLAATGRDAKARKQYRYNADFIRVRDTAKYEHVLAFAHALPALREKIAKDMALSGMPREKVLATIVHLLEQTLIRIGNEDYAKDNGSFGLTTLRNRHVKVDGAELLFVFMGKSGKSWKLKIHNRRVAKVVRACQELPGQHLFQYLDENGGTQKIGSADVNAYLRDITGRDITAKDFRTWSGTVAAALQLHQALKEAAPTKKQIKLAMEFTAGRLGNTPTICRKCYVHPEIIAAYEAGDLRLRIGQAANDDGLHPDEAAVLRFLKKRLKAAA